MKTKRKCRAARDAHYWGQWSFEQRLKRLRDKEKALRQRPARSVPRGIETLARLSNGDLTHLAIVDPRNTKTCPTSSD